MFKLFYRDRRDFYRSRGIFYGRKGNGRGGNDPAVLSPNKLDGPTNERRIAQGRRVYDPEGGVGEH